MTGSSASVTVAMKAVDTSAASSSTGLWSSLLTTMVALAFVLALAWFFLRLLKRTSAMRAIDGRQPPQVLQAIPLSPRERLVIVRDGDHEYMLGVTSTNITLIDKRPAQASPAPSQSTG